MCIGFLSVSCNEKDKSDYRNKRERERPIYLITNFKNKDDSRKRFFLYTSYTINHIIHIIWREYKGSLQSIAIFLYTNKRRSTSRGDVSLGINIIIDISMNFEAGLQIHPPTRMRNSCRHNVAKLSALGVGIHVLLRDITRHSRVCDERVCVVTATSTRFHRTVIDRGSRCGSPTKSTLSYRTNVESPRVTRYFL